MIDGPDRFNISEDISVSQSEADMDMSASEQSGDPPDRKRVKRATDVDVSDVPKWSNPDPYTALPPPDESRVKKRDVVKLIRKSKVAANILPNASQNAIAENADFVSFDFASDRDEDEAQSTKNVAQHPVVAIDPPEIVRDDTHNGRPQKPLKRKRQDDEGDVLPSWIASSQAVATPWNKADHSVTQPMGLW
jgi:non-canonical poly(A) RNA polymerase PAPD5/7